MVGERFGGMGGGSQVPQLILDKRVGEPDKGGGRWGIGEVETITNRTTDSNLPFTYLLLW